MSGYYIRCRRYSDKYAWFASSPNTGRVLLRSCKVWSSARSCNSWCPFLRLTVCPWYTQCTLTGQDNLWFLASYVLFEKKYYRPMLHNHFTTPMRPVSNQLEPCVSRGTRDIAGWTVGCQLSTILTDALCSSTPARTMQS